MQNALLGLLATLFIPENFSPESDMGKKENLIEQQIAFNIETEEKEEEVFLIKNDENVLLEVPYFNQVEDLPEDQRGIVGVTACGPSAIASSLNYLGQDIDLIDVINKLPTTVYIKGDRFYNLYKAAEYFDTKTVKIGKTPRDFYETLSNGHPIVLNVQNYEGYTGHALTIVGIVDFDGEKAKSLIIHDPYRAGYRVFEYGENNTLMQPEGYINTIGILEPFYLEPLDIENS